MHNAKTLLEIWVVIITSYFEVIISFLTFHLYDYYLTCWNPTK